MLSSRASLALLALIIPALGAPLFDGRSNSLFNAPNRRSAPPPASNNGPLLSQFQNEIPQPIRGNKGATILGPQNVPLDRENPDFLASPSTDSGTVANAKWPFSFSHNRVEEGGWARQQNVNDLPAATRLAGVNMRLKTGAIRLAKHLTLYSVGKCLMPAHFRELHWHTAAEVRALIILDICTFL